MVDLSELGKPKPTAKKTDAKRPERGRSQNPSVIEWQSNNLHKPPRGERIARQFKISPNVSDEFDHAAIENGYNRRQGSEFFENIWEFWKKHNKHAK